MKTIVTESTGGDNFNGGVRQDSEAESTRQIRFLVVMQEYRMRQKRINNGV